MADSTNEESLPLLYKVILHLLYQISDWGRDRRVFCLALEIEFWIILEHKGKPIGDEAWHDFSIIFFEHTLDFLTMPFGNDYILLVLRSWSC